jgi:uncharacterized protein DUF4410
MTRLSLVLFLFGFELSVSSNAAEAIRSQYQSLEIKQFGIPGNVGITNDYLEKLMADLVAEIGNTHRFGMVFREGTMGDDVPMPRLQLVGSISKFQRGSQMKRYMLGPGFGKTTLKAHVQFVDVQTGKVVLERDVDGKVIMGMYGGDSMGATLGLAKEVAKTAKKYL